MSDDNPKKPRRPSRGRGKPKGKRPGPAFRGAFFCDYAICDMFTQKWTVVGVFNSFVFPSYPAEPASFVVFSELTDGIGSYLVTLELVDASTGAIMGQISLGPVEFEERMESKFIQIRIPSIKLPHEGKYDIVFKADGSEVLRSSFDAVLRRGPGEPIGGVDVG